MPRAESRPGTPIITPRVVELPDSGDELARDQEVETEPEPELEPEPTPGMSRDPSSDINELNQEYYTKTLRSGHIQNTIKLANSANLSPNLRANSPKSAQNILNLENLNTKYFSDSEPKAQISNLSLYALAVSSYVDSLNEGTYISTLNKAFKEPDSYKEANSSIYKEYWHSAMKTEFNTLASNNT